jgi:hypothetical protein
MLIRLTTSSRKIRKIHVTALLTNGMSELPPSMIEENLPRVYPIPVVIADFHAPTAY